MLSVLADLALESEAATALGMRLARAFDHQSDPLEVAVRRILTPAAKFFVCKRAVAMTGEAMEALGGIGYVEEAPMARLYREAPVNSIWEGSGNVMCLDVLRAAAKSPESVDALRGELQLSAGGNAHYDRFLSKLFDLWAQPTEALEPQGRVLTQGLALAAQAALLIRHAPSWVSEAFCASRLDPGHGHVFGALPPGVAARAIAERAAGGLWN
jgi:putative acyl-CoA dehydrogenase